MGRGHCQRGALTCLPAPTGWDAASQCRTAGSRPPPFPDCTVITHPSPPWSSSEFEGLLEKTPAEANAFLADPEKYIAGECIVRRTDVGFQGKNHGLRTLVTELGVHPAARPVGDPARWRRRARSRPRPLRCPQSRTAWFKSPAGVSDAERCNSF